MEMKSTTQPPRSINDNNNNDHQLGDDTSLSKVVQVQHINSEEDKKEQVNYGSLLATESYIYQSARKKDSPSQQLGIIHDNDDGSKKTDTGNSVTPQPHFTGQDDNKRCIRALTRTMIGDWIWKYTRKVVGSGISEKKHKRFFWLHPYSKTLYWSNQEPGLDGCEYSTKCVMIESFVIIRNEKIPSFYIQTSHRGLKIQCTDDGAYSDWFKSLKYLLIDTPPMASPTMNLEQNDKDKQNMTNHRRLTKLLKYHPPSMTKEVGPVVRIGLDSRPWQHQNQHRKTLPTSAFPLNSSSAVSPHHHSSSSSLRSDMTPSGMVNASSLSLPQIRQRNHLTTDSTNEKVDHSRGRNRFVWDTSSSPIFFWIRPRQNVL
ncbi:meiotic cell cortex C-terminal pleckstrin homology-domain-containing protein [Halteromyces radiatus]|uniref:meiotic cell cortex C-terminal pleckstrin homology-domain-containing protein n=1 Tax=Halteromyces radiatus TaxID=101107 RepID=UPI00221E4C44|nr:meiotic cell cortex C-terminal pleckstrin homology-domain-containing protein [Halteromyces radiatus]KAI8081537.1 meiotic cell cortex C-terminal pleckstrin homology-domain-containing protein [Halteromyces radiatus]